MRETAKGDLIQATSGFWSSCCEDGVCTADTPAVCSNAISQGEKDYKLILSRPSAMADFEKLLSVGNPQAKCYALVGIRTLELNRFKELLRTLRNPKEEVQAQFGCMRARESIGSCSSEH